jgi:membrane fusion protein, copper/silver efflux system
MNNKTEEPGKPSWLMPAVLGGGAVAGLLLALLLPASWLFVAPDVTHDHDTDEVAEGGKFYACPMFCTRLDAPGICPVCDMVLEEFVDTGELVPLDARQRHSVGLRAEELQRRVLAREVRTLGTFEPDETRRKVVAAWVEGRVDRLYADFTGVPVSKGWHLFDLYSPTLYAAQQELMVARNAARREDASDSARTEAERMLENARERLRLLGLDDAQIAHIETLDQPKLTITIPSPADGVVMEKLVQAGQYVTQGQHVYRIADLSRLWLIVDVHERDLGWVALGQEVSVQVNAFPGRSFQGRVGFVDPGLSLTTRTVRVRVEVPNPDGELKPGMFGTASIFAQLGRGGRVARPDLHGEYACPMHPLQRAESLDHQCEICGMDFVPDPREAGQRPAAVWAVPREAVLTTGRRHLVYVEWWVRIPPHDEHAPDVDPPVEVLSVPEYQGFEVTLGPLAAEYHIMEDGTRHKLREYYPLLDGVPTGIPSAKDRPGIRIVTNGQFLIDSQRELTGKPSLMRPQGGEAVDPHEGH